MEKGKTVKKLFCTVSKSKASYFTIFTFYVLSVSFSYSAVEITADYENGKVWPGVKIKETADKVVVDTGNISAGKDLWFNFKITGCKGKTIVFNNMFASAVDNKYLHTVSYKPVTEFFNNSYEVTEPGIWAGYRYTFSHSFREDTAYVSFSFPATNTMLDNYMAKIKNDPLVGVQKLCDSAIYSLPVELISVTDKSVDDKDKKTAFILSREDALDSGGTLVMAGALRYLLSDDTMAKEIRKKFTFVFLPLLARDGVKMGSTNWPASEKGTVVEYFSYPSTFLYNEKRLKEVDALKAYVQNIKKNKKKIDVFHNLHSAQPGDSTLFVRPNPGDAKSKDIIREYCMNVRMDCLQHYIISNSDTSDSSKYLTRYMQRELGALAVHSQTDCYYNNAKRCENDYYTDGELLVKGIGRAFSVNLPEDTPPVLYAGNVGKFFAKKGEKITFDFFYRDLLERPAKDMKIVIGEKVYPVVLENGTHWKRGWEYKIEIPVEAETNDYYIEVSAGSTKRRLPENGLLLGPYIK